MPEIRVDTSAGAHVTVSDRWDDEKREGEGRIVMTDAEGRCTEIALTASEAAILSNALSKVAWSAAAAWARPER